MRRGDVVIAIMPRETGKPRPAVIIQSDLRNAREPTGYLVCPLSTTPTGLPYRPSLEPRPGNGLRQPSEAMTDRVTRVSAGRLAQTAGRLAADELAALDDALMVVLGLA